METGEAKKIRTGIFCGSFDPIHAGHAMVASYVAQFAGLDELWLMPSPLNPLKAESKPASNDDRMAMCRLVAERIPRCRVSDFEQRLPLPSYTFRTLRELKKEYPDRDFVLVIGSDNWQIFPRWRNWEEILRDFDVLIYPRPWYGVSLGNAYPRVALIEDPEAPSAQISSTFIRRAVAEGKETRFWLTPEVADYIRVRGLYGSPECQDCRIPLES